MVQFVNFTVHWGEYCLFIRVFLENFEEIHQIFRRQSMAPPCPLYGSLNDAKSNQKNVEPGFDTLSREGYKVS